MNASAAPSPPPTRHAPIALWRVAEAFMHTLYALFGAPEDFAADHTLTRAAHTLMASWIRCAEAMLRRLLLIEASAFPKPNTRPLLHPTRQPARKAMGFDADKPEAWRVSFRCLQHPSSPARGGGGRAAIGGGANALTRDALALHRPLSHASRDSSPVNGGARRFSSAWPPAERYEALVRVFMNPEPYARRLARQLHALPHRIRELFRKPEEAQHRIEDWDVFDAGAQRAWPITDSS